MRWLKDHWGLLLIAFIILVGFVLAIVVERKDRPKFDDLINELKLEKQVIDAKAKAAKVAAAANHGVASAEITKEFETDIAKMDVADKKKVEELKDDPEALVEHLLRATV